MFYLLLQYIQKKNEINESLFERYSDMKYRQYKFYGYINRTRAFDKMLNEIESAYGKDSILIYGDWSISKQMRNFISTPNIGMKRKIMKRFETYDIDEYRTSKLYHRTQTITENLSYVSKKNNKTYELHSVRKRSLPNI